MVFTATSGGMAATATVPPASTAASAPSQTLETEPLATGCRGTRVISVMIVSCWLKGSSGL
jgi:hypothetical protein